MTPKLPGLLVRHIQQKRCVVFVGAGLSVPAGLPTWGRLLSNGIKELVGSLPEGELHQAELNELVAKGKLLEVADFCKEKLGSAYHQFLSEQVRGDQAEKLPPTHEVLMRLPFSAWVTTNYDKLLERAYSEVRKGGYPKTLTHKDTEALGRLLFDGGPFILKAHGDIDRPETVVLTSRDYSDIIHANPAFNEIFSGLLLTKALLFVGYSLSDPDFRLLMDRQLAHFKGFVPERYALMTGVGPVERDVLWRTARIQVISYENANKDHAEVLEFLKALEAEVLPKQALESVQPAQSSSAPVLESARPPQSSPGPAPVPPAKHVVPYNFSAGSGPGSPVPGGRVAQLLQEDDASAPPAAPSPQPTAQAPRSPQALPMAPHQLFIETVEGRLQLQLWRGAEVPVVQGTTSTRMSAEEGRALLRDLSHGSSSRAGLYTPRVRRFFEEYLPRNVLEALAEEGPWARAPLELHLSPGTAHFPWELFLVGGKLLSLERMLIREPVGIPTQVRGTPRLRPRPRILLIEGLQEAGSRGELDRIAALYTAPDFELVRIQGRQATFARVLEELRADRDDELPDLIHYTGRMDRVEYELALLLAGTEALSEGALRSVLSRGRLPFLMVNAPGSAFSLSGDGVAPGFMDLAAQQGVGAFVGTFGQPEAQAGTDFMAVVHRALAAGRSIAQAMLQARQQELHAKFPRNATALLYVLSGDGALQLVNSQQE